MSIKLGFGLSVKVQIRVDGIKCAVGGVAGEAATNHAHFLAHVGSQVSIFEVGREFRFDLGRWVAKVKLPEGRYFSEGMVMGKHSQPFAGPYDEAERIGELEAEVACLRNDLEIMTRLVDSQPIRTNANI